MWRIISVEEATLDRYDGTLVLERFCSSSVSQEKELPRSSAASSPREPRSS
jgi:hypothetical protein